MVQKVLIVGDDNFTFTPCLLDNQEQWLSKSGGDAEGGAPPQDNWQVEVACCLAANKVPTEYQSDLIKLQQRGIPVHFSVNPALLRQYFPCNDGGGAGGPAAAATPEIQQNTAATTGPPYDIILFLLPGLQFEGCPRYIEKNSELFKLRLQLYWFALAKSSTVIAKQNGRVMFLWVNQAVLQRQYTAQAFQTLPMPLLDIHKLGPFCKILRDANADFRLNLAWGDYKLKWKPLLHNVELLHFPRYLEELKVYCFRNSPYVPPQNGTPPANETDPNANGKNNEDFNLLRIPQSICQWDRTVLPHVNELFHFNMRTCVPGEMLQISKLSVKYDPRITGWRNSGHAAPQQMPLIQPTAAVGPEGSWFQQAPNVQGGVDQQQQPTAIFTSSWNRFLPAASQDILGTAGAAGTYGTSQMMTGTDLAPGKTLQETQPAYETGSAFNAARWSAFQAGYWPSSAPPLPTQWGAVAPQPASPNSHQTESAPYYTASNNASVNTSSVPANPEGSSSSNYNAYKPAPHSREVFTDYAPEKRPRRLSGSSSRAETSDNATRGGTAAGGGRRSSPNRGTYSEEYGSRVERSSTSSRYEPYARGGRNQWAANSGEDEQRYGPQRRDRRPRRDGGGSSSGGGRESYQNSKRFVGVSESPCSSDRYERRYTPSNARVD